MGGAGPKPGAEQPLWMGNSATNSTPNEKTAEKSSAKGGVLFVKIRLDVKNSQ